LELTEGLPKCYLDPQLTVQVILNLITNAIEAMKEDKTNRPKYIKISTTPAERRNRKFIRVDVADSGPGISPGAEEKIFDPFYTTKPSGTGIGLSICQRIVNDQQGIMTQATSDWGGALFTIMFPVEKRGR
jgi:signal transduction histidine kinase